MIDLTNKQFGRLTVIKRTGTHTTPNGGKTPTWLCICECGNCVEVLGSNLRKGNTKSCGCLQKEYAHQQTNTLRHGEEGTRLYKIWQQMKYRCSNSPSNNHYDNYAARGITVCDEWANDYSTFAEWARQNGYSDELTIDRIDVNGNYEPSNCRWATMAEQNRNKTTTFYVTIDGETKCLKDWAREFGIKYSTVQMRIERGWKVEDALTAPIRSHGRSKI